MWRDHQEGELLALSYVRQWVGWTLEHMWVSGLEYVVWESADIIGLVHIGGWIVLSRSQLVGGLYCLGLN